jgi:hypothetical protein
MAPWSSLICDRARILSPNANSFKGAGDCEDQPVSFPKKGSLMSGADAITALVGLGLAEDLTVQHELRIGIDAIPFIRKFFWRSYGNTGRVVVDVLQPVADHPYRPDDIQLMELWNDGQLTRAKEELEAHEAVKSVMDFCC